MSLRPFIILLLLVFGVSGAFAQKITTGSPKIKKPVVLSKIYHKDWIDLNKNGKKDIYEDPQQPVDRRVNDLIQQMNLDEKTCQMATLYGWKRVLKDSLPTPSWKTAIWKDGIANIDEHLNGFVNWGKKTSGSELVKDIKKHAWAMNETQRFFIEQTPRRGSSPR